MNRRITFEMLGGNIDDRLFIRGDITDEKTIQNVIGTYDEVDDIAVNGLVQNENAYTKHYIGDKRLYQTFYRKTQIDPYQYAGLCELGKSCNMSPRAGEKTFIISRFRGETAAEEEFNIKLTKAVARKIYAAGDMPIAPHLYFPNFLKDEGYERAWGIEAGHMLMDLCDSAVLIIVDHNISEGMQADIEYAVNKLAIKIKKYYFSKEEAEKFIVMENGNEK